MTLSDSGSNPTNWPQLYLHGSGNGGDGGGTGSSIMFNNHATMPVSESTVVTTTAMTPVIVGATGSAASVFNHSNVEGRVAKPARKRSRASRKAPTTMLNTDTANFRAMVQQFTGISSAPYASEFPATGEQAINFNPNFNESLQSYQPYGHMQQQQQQYQQARQSYQQFQRQHQQYQERVFTLGNENPNEAFFQGFNNSSLEVHDGFFLDGISGQMVARPASTGNKADEYYP